MKSDFEYLNCKSLQIAIENGEKSISPIFIFKWYIKSSFCMNNSQKKLQSIGKSLIVQRSFGGFNI